MDTPIPAYPGISRILFFVRGHQGGAPSVHPRACGEQCTPSRFSYSAFGSSPRVRGTGGLGNGITSEPRFIPARAGNSRAGTRRRHEATVHPRACGEQLLGHRGLLPVDGSSPRVRGTGHEPPCPYSMQRFIPARAGNRWCARRGCGSRPVHPRACGEQVLPSVSRDICIGSSPRVRGTADRANDWQRYRRFIPARAGNRGRSGTPSKTAPVHPRACGEQCALRVFGVIHVGSSPRVRGTAVDVQAAIAAGRFIPARAGNRLTTMSLI